MDQGFKRGNKKKQLTILLHMRLDYLDFGFKITTSCLGDIRIRLKN